NDFSGCKIHSMPKMYQHILALAFAVKEINKNPKLLPNITLGFHIINGYYIAKMTYKATLNLLCAQQRFVPNFICDSQKELICSILFQLTYGSFSPAHGDKTAFPFLYQMVPNEDYQFRGVLQLLHHFGWMWVGLLAVDDDYGDRFLKAIMPLLTQNSICYAFILRLPKRSYVDEYLDFMIDQVDNYRVLMERKANACFVYGEPPSWQDLRMLLFYVPFFSLPPLGKVWIATSQWDFESLSVQQLWDIQHFHGALTFTVHSNEPLGFQKFIHSIKPSWTIRDGFIQNFWEQAFLCSLKNSNVNVGNTKFCTAEEKLDSLPHTFFEMKMIGHSYNIYNAVYAVGHALHAIYKSKFGHKRFQEGGRFHHSLKNILFNNSAGDNVRFDENRELVTGFDLTNWVTFSNNSFVRVNVGRLEPQAPPCKQLTISDDLIEWHRRSRQKPSGQCHFVLPLSVCNDNCYPGFSRKKKEGEKFCCYDCAPCPEGMISGQKDMDACMKCLADKYPNKDQNQCIPRILSYLSYKEPLGIFATRVPFMYLCMCVHICIMLQVGGVSVCMIL
uniref:Receptor ligand binding region domain-containing protein n=1 Tax=Podarcis muralis TaxID=64176 RepID=A0A670K594_PODMU